MNCRQRLAGLIAATALAVLAVAPAAAQSEQDSGYSIRAVYRAATGALGMAPTTVPVSAPAAAAQPAPPSRAPAPDLAQANSPVTAATDAGADLLGTAVQGVTGTVGSLVNVLNFADIDSPARQLAQIRSARGYEFWALVADAGFELKEADTDVGLIPEFKFKFDKARELSDADRVWLERKLKRHARFNKGLMAKIKRGLVHALLEAHDLNEGFSLESFDVGFTPLPTLAFSVAPKDSRLLDKEHDALYRAILANRATVKRVNAPPKPATATPAATMR